MRSMQTRASYAGILKRFLAQHDPDHVTRRTVEDFIHARSDKLHTRDPLGSPATATINARLSALSSFYRYASTYIPENETQALWTLANPTLGIQRGKPERSPKGLTSQEMELLFSQISTTSEIGLRDRAALLLIFWSSRRRSEISDLRFGDIQPASFPDGQGGMRQGWIFFFRGKGHKSERDSQELVPIVKNVIDWYLIASGRIETIKASDPLFTVASPVPGRGGNVRPGEVRPFTGSMLAKRMALYAKQARVKASLHTLRHTSARIRYESGSDDIRAIQHLLRHQNISTTDVYLRSLVGTEDPGYKMLEKKLLEQGFDFLW